MNVLISGGAKNGKTDIAAELARRQAEAGGPLYYIATMIPFDEEDRKRIRTHIRQRRGMGFQTLEQGTGILTLLEREDVDSNGAFLLDSTTALLANEMFPAPSENSSDWYDPSAAERVPAELEEFARRTGNTVFVSDNIFSDARIPETDPEKDLTEVYRKALAAADRKLAGICDRVLEVSAGTIKVWKDAPEAGKSELKRKL